mgnify:CR=1 FL=1
MKAEAPSEEEKAKDALAIYETLTFDLARIADNMTFGKDVVMKFMEEEFGIETVDYDAKEGKEVLKSILILYMVKT